MTAAIAERARPAFGPLIVPLLAVAIFINYVDRGNLSMAAPVLKDELKLSATQIGVLTSAFFWSYMPAQILSGWIIERINAYRALAAGLALWSLATLCMGFASGFAALLALRLVLGLGESVSIPCSSKLIAQHLPAERRGRANGLLCQGLSLGPAVGVFFGGLLMTQLGWRGVFLLFGALSLLWIVPWLTATRQLSAEASAEGEDGPSPPIATILKRPELWASTLGHIAGNYGIYLLAAWLPLYLVKERGYDLTQMATIGGVIYLVFAAGSYFSGWISDRWILAGASPTRVLRTVAVCLYVTVAAGLVACAFGDDQVAMAGLAVAAFAVGMAGPNILAISQTISGPRVAGKWMGVQNGLANLSGVVGPVVTGFIIDRTGGFEVAFLVAAAVALMGVLCYGFLIRQVAPIDWGEAQAA